MKGDVHQSIYGSLLTLYPRSFRSEYGPDMEQLFRDRLRDARRAGDGLISLWLLTILDLIETAFSQRLEHLMTRNGFIRAAGAAGMLAGLLGIPALAWATWAPNRNDGVLALPALLVIVAMFGVHMRYSPAAKWFGQTALVLTFAAPFIAAPFGWGAAGVLFPLWGIAYALFLVAAYKSDVLPKAALLLQAFSVPVTLVSWLASENHHAAFPGLTLFFASWIWLGYALFNQTTVPSNPATGAG